MSDQGLAVFKDRYEVHHKLARGGMSDVYLARDRVLDRPVALKVLFPEYAKDATFVARFRREAQAAAKLNHPNIVAVYDWGEEGGTYFIAMEYVEGQTLSELVRAEGPQHPRRAAEIAADVAAALGFAHRNGVVHRDVKPGNVMVEQSGHVKVADFGIAQAINGPEQTQLTRVGSVMGTASYFSPEQAQGHQVDPRSDIYSLGCVLFEMLTARAPFAGESPVAIAYKHVQESPPIPSSLGVAVPAPLEAIVLTCLAKQPDGRYATAEDLRADLLRFLEGRPVMASGGVSDATAAHGGPGSPTGGFGAVGAAGLGAAAGAAAGYAYGHNQGYPADATSAMPVTGMGPGAPTGAQPPYGTGMTPAAGYPPEPEKKTNPWLIGGMVAFLIIVAVGLIFIAREVSNTPSVAQKPVPSVIGQQRAVAEATLRAQGFTNFAIQTATDDRPVDQVIAQDPAENALALPASKITLTVSSGPNALTVPDVVGVTESRAKDTLNSAGFVPQSTPQPSDTVAKGNVISQSPAANSKLGRNGTVVIAVSTGPDSAEVPDVTNLPESQAAARLGQAGFTNIQRRDQIDEDVGAGRVIQTVPGPGGKHGLDDPIVMVVSSGPATTTTSSTTTSSTTSSSSTTTSTRSFPTTTP